MKKDDASVITYLQMIQNVISRMATNSGACKVLVATILTALSFNESISVITYLIVIVYGFIEDSYYLAHERIYREKYNNFLDMINNEKVDEKCIYEMKPRNSNYEGELFFKMIKSMISFSVWSYYLVLILVILIVKGGI